MKKKSECFCGVRRKSIKLFRIMKLTLMLMLIGIFQVSANVNAQNGKMNVQVSNIQLSDFLWQLQEESDIVFIYQTDDLKDVGGITIERKDASITEILDAILVDTNLEYTLNKSVVIIKRKETEPLIVPQKKQEKDQEKKQIKGVVTDDNGMTLPGVSVVVKGTTNGVSTDIDGHYSIDLAGEGEVLVFSFVGMVTKEFVVRNQSQLDVVLNTDASQLAEIVVTGYTQQKKETYTGASITLKEESLQKSNVEPSFLKTLQGQAPGVLVTDNVGDPDRKPTIRIRGTGSISADSEPLIIMDGVIITDSNILNATDIESITVQKDATATAIYGSRGSNGVIIVTTKKGKPGKPVVTYDFKQGIGFVQKSNINLMDASQKLGYEVDLGIKTREQANELLKKGINTDWQDELYKTSKIQTHNLSLSGGSAVSRYSLSTSYHNEETIYGSKYEKYTGRLGLDSKLSDKLSVGVNLMFSRSDHDSNRISSYDVSANMYNPYENGRNKDGSLSRLVSNKDNIQYMKRKLTDVTESNSFNSIVFGTYRILPELIFRTQWGLSYSSFDGERFTDPSASPTYVKPENRGSLSNSFSKNQAVTATQTLNYTKIIDSKHYFKALLGFEFNESKNKYFSASAMGFSSGKIKTLSAGANASATSGKLGHSGMLSYFSQISYAYKDTYFTDISIRRDGSSKFGDNKKYANFWSLGGGWNLHKETFMQNTAFNTLKIKGSVGTSGNASIGDFQAKLLYAGDGNYAGKPGIYPSRLENKDLTWERNFNFGFGLDYAVFNSRLSGSIDFYQRKTTDLLLQIDPLGTSGFVDASKSSPYMANVGEMVNKGVDLALRFEVLQKEDWNWSVSLNLSYNENEVLKLNEKNDIVIASAIYREGEAANSLYLVEWLGVDSKTGKNQYLDKNGLVTNRTEDKKIVAKTDPPYYGGFISELSYKNFDLYALFSFVKGKYTLNSGLYELYNQPLMNQSTDVLNAWKTLGDKASIAKRSTSLADRDNKFSTQFMEDASFLRLKSVNLSYNLPEKWLRKVYLSRAKVYIQGQNLLTWTNMSVGNPESAGTSVGFPPNVRKVMLGVNVNF